MIRVLLVDDQSVVRRALRVRFHLEPDLQVVGKASTGKGALSLAQALTPDVVLMDIEMPAQAPLRPKPLNLKRQWCRNR